MSQTHGHIALSSAVNKAGELAIFASFNDTKFVPDGFVLNSDKILFTCGDQVTKSTYYIEKSFTDLLNKAHSITLVYSTSDDCLHEVIIPRKEAKS